MDVKLRLETHPVHATAVCEVGRMNDRLATYIIPTIKDAPKGVGTLPMDGGAPAAVAAIENASGIVPDVIPATPERLQVWGVAGQRVGGAG